MMSWREDHEHMPGRRIDKRGICFQRLRVALTVWGDLDVYAHAFAYVCFVQQAAASARKRG